MKMLLGEDKEKEDGEEGSSEEESDIQDDDDDDSGDEEEHQMRGDSDYLQTRDMDIPRVSGIKVVSSKAQKQKKKNDMEIED